MARRTLPLALLTLTLSATAAVPSHKKVPPPPTAPIPTPSQNPLLPPAIPLDSLFLDLSLVAKTSQPTPPTFAPLYSQEDWQTYRTQFAADADTLPKKKSSALIDFSKKLIAAANDPTAGGTSPGLQRLLLLRAAIDCFRTRDGFPTANNAVTAYLEKMDIHSPLQVAALWTLANAMSRTVSTPRPSRIHYSAIAARANMQLTLLLLDQDQLAAAQTLQNLVGYHEGWVHTTGVTPEDRVAYTQIAQVKALVHQTQTTMDFLATQYQPAINGDDNALMAIYLYGRFVKNKPALVADLPDRKPSSPLAQLAAALNAADHNPSATYSAAETLKIVASTLPDGVLKQRTLYAALQNYRAFIAAPSTEHDRIKRTLARMAIESVIADGARGPAPLLNPFAAPNPATTIPAPAAPIDTPPLSDPLETTPTPSPTTPTPTPPTPAASSSAGNPPSTPPRATITTPSTPDMPMPTQ